MCQSTCPRRSRIPQEREAARLRDSPARGRARGRAEPPAGLSSSVLPPQFKRSTWPPGTGAASPCSSAWPFASGSFRWKLPEAALRSECLSLASSPSCWLDVGMTSGADAAALFREAVSKGRRWQKVAGAAFPPGRVGAVPAERCAAPAAFTGERFTSSRLRFLVVHVAFPVLPSLTAQSPGQVQPQGAVQCRRTVRVRSTRRAPTPAPRNKCTKDSPPRSLGSEQLPSDRVPAPNEWK